MRKLLYIVALLLLPLMAGAQYNSQVHRLGLAYSAGATVIPAAEAFAAGPETELGFAYEWQARSFLLQTGVCGKWTSSFLLPGDRRISLPGVIDTQGEPMLLHVDLQRMKAEQHELSAHLPLMAGGRWRSFYMLAGLQAGVTLWGTCKASSEYSFAAQYDYFDTELTDMPQHGLVSHVEMPRRKPLGFSAEVVPMIELGSLLNYRHERLTGRQVRLAGYVGYRIPIYRTDAPGSFDALYSVSDIRQLPERMPLAGDAIADEMSYRLAAGRIVAGIKFTILFRVATPRCVICMQ